ncbi:pleiotropic drug resistance protein 2-like [Rhododendron vialii]|uniref:pleiotropic drug resistance protein 2-like n=1 Tax=Rhododendron vialii TaxID=182163 RepID=UPI00265E9648|nr:pleiotropic drug resistance protein 2-like [Rhododendron vialii]
MAALPQDDLTRSSSSRRSFASTNRGNCASASIREAWRGQPEVFSRTTSQREREDDEENLRWAAINRLPTYDRLRKGMLNRVLDNEEIVQGEVDVTKLGNQDKKLLMDSVLKTAEEGNERFLQRLRDRTDR